VLHIDFQRVSASEKLHIKVPLHFINGEVSPAVKLGGQMISHVINEIDVACLPKDLPEFIEVDLSKLENDQSLHVADITLPKGVEVVHHGDGNPVIATALKTGGGSDETAAEGGEAEA
jgi:large subunit ribosomal protein L25